ncbi:MAG: multidrug efflux SMR transporter [Syntrophaceae bacterium]|nr:multidrug efflux SMR transporter [Syntrophaceae bacterium]
MREWFFLTVAIVCEVLATSTLKSTESFTRLWPSLIVLTGYALSFYFLALTLKVIPVGVAYAIWSGLGTTLIVLIAWLILGQKLDLPALAGIFLIVSGVVILNVFSKSIAP